MADPLRHRQTKGAATDMVDLTPPRHIPTLPPPNPGGVVTNGRKGAISARSRRLPRVTAKGRKQTVDQRLADDRYRRVPVTAGVLAKVPSRSDLPTFVIAHCQPIVS